LENGPGWVGERGPGSWDGRAGHQDRS
jgi:hypothetical protein